jgi:hypothetical protein
MTVRTDLVLRVGIGDARVYLPLGKLLKPKSRRKRRS